MQLLLLGRKQSETKRIHLVIKHIANLNCNYIHLMGRADNKMSIVHLYFGADTTVPKLRRRMYDDVDLIGMFYNYF
jgi:hypothetical protein